MSSSSAVASRDVLCRLANNKDGKVMEGKWRLVAATVLCTLFMVGEVVGGIYAHSLAVLTDAAHMLSDVCAFIISLLAGTYALRESKATHTFGYHRVEVMGSLVSVAIIWIATGILVYEAVLRITTPELVDGKLMFILAVTGIAVNIINLFVLGGLKHGHGHSHADAHALEQERRQVDGQSDSPQHAALLDSAYNNHDNSLHWTRPRRTSTSLAMRGAVVHVLGDCAQRFGVVIAAIIIWVKPEYHVVDPICTFIFAIAVLFTTKSIFIDITDIIMERVPRGFDVAGLTAALCNVHGVDSMHDLHVWALKPGMLVMAVHIDIVQGVNPSDVVRNVTSEAVTKGISHCTVQLHAFGEACPDVLTILLL